MRPSSQRLLLASAALLFLAGSAAAVGLQADANVQTDAVEDAQALAPAGAVPTGVPPAPGLPASPAPLSSLTETQRGLAELPLSNSIDSTSLDAPLEGTPLAARASASGPKAQEAFAAEIASGRVPLAAGAGIAVAGVALASAAARPFFALLTPLYSRLDKGELLNHPVRRDLLRMIKDEPGVNISDLHGRIQMGWGALLYHLQRLEAQGYVVSHRWGRSRRYFLNERSLEVRAPGIRALKAPNARVLAERIAAQPGRTQEELAVSMDLSKSVVSKYAKRLEDASLVRREMGRNCLRLFPTAELRELLHAMPEAPASSDGSLPAPAASGGVPVEPRAPERLLAVQG